MAVLTESLLPDSHGSEFKTEQTQSVVAVPPAVERKTA